MRNSACLQKVDEIIWGNIIFKKLYIIKGLWLILSIQCQSYLLWITVMLHWISLMTALSLSDHLLFNMVQFSWKIMVLKNLVHWIYFSAFTEVVCFNWSKCIEIFSLKVKFSVVDSWRYKLRLTIQFFEISFADI